MAISLGLRLIWEAWHESVVKQRSGYEVAPHEVLTNWVFVSCSPTGLVEVIIGMLIIITMRLVERRRSIVGGL